MTDARLALGAWGEEETVSFLKRQDIRFLNGISVHWSEKLILLALIVAIWFLLRSKPGEGMP